MKNSPFSPAAVVFIVAAGVILMALSFILSAFTPEGAVGDEPRYNPHSFSTSYIGHAGFHETLKMMGRPVQRGLNDSLDLAGRNGTVLVLEPKFGVFDGDYGEELLEAPRLLVALPKWRGSPYFSNYDWVGQVGLISEKEVLNILNLVDGEAGLSRGPWPEYWLENEFSFAPTGQGQVQLMTSPDMNPLVRGPNGILLGELSWDDQKIWVLSDPDVLSNQGLGLGDNAALMIEVVDRLRLWDNDDGGAPLIIDEVVHGLKAADDSIWSMLFRFPYVIVTILAAASALMLVLAGSGRFGPPLKPKKELDFGKATLIDNSVRLLDFAGHQTDILKNYIWMNIRLVARNLHAPRGKGDQAVLEWLDRLGQARGVSLSCSEIVRAATSGQGQNDEQLYHCAREIHRWKGEMLNGPQSSRSHS